MKRNRKLCFYDSSVGLSSWKDFNLIFDNFFTEDFLLNFFKFKTEIDFLDQTHAAVIGLFFKILTSLFLCEMFSRGK